jgi:hypothetical protein
MRPCVIVALLFSLGCAKRIPAPVFTERHCPAGSVRHVASYNSQLIEICEDTATHGLFAISDVCNPYGDTDCDEAKQDKGKAKHSWWRFWSHATGTD